MNKIQLLNFTAQFVVILGDLITYAIIGRVLVSWFSINNFDQQRGRFSQFLYDVTDPVINLTKKIPHKIGMMDFSPLIALLGVDLLVNGILFLLNKV